MRSAEAPVRRIILISIDSLRFDAIGCESDTRYLDRYELAASRCTPTLDALAAEGVRIRQAISAASWTPVSHATMFTGCYPPRHGVRTLIGEGLSSSVRTVAERLRGLGYRTIASIDLLELFRLARLTRGFDHVMKADDRALFTLLEARRDEPFFLFVHFEDVHWPYGESPCPPWDGYGDDAYDEEIRCARELGLGGRERAALTRSQLFELAVQVVRHCQERAIADTVMFPRYLRGVNKFDGGRFRVFVERLRTLGVLDGALLIVTADHGEAALPAHKRADRGIPQKFCHGEAVTEELIRVPLIVRAPGRLPAGRVLDVQVSLADLAPTILEYAGARPPQGIDGVGLRSLLEGAVETARPDAYSETWYHNHEQLEVALQRSKEAGRVVARDDDAFLFQASLRTPRYKYVETGDDLTDAERALPDAEFARVAIRKLLGRVETSIEWNATVTVLRQGTSRDAVIAALRARHFHRRALYDLSADPWEDVNLLGADVASRVLGGQARYALVAEPLGRRLRAIQGRPEQDDVQEVVQDREATAAVALALQATAGAAAPRDVPVPEEAGQEAQARAGLRRAAALGALGEIDAMRAQLLDALRACPWVLRYAWARLEAARIACRVAMASDAPVGTMRAVCGEIATAVDGGDRRWLRQTLADAWAGLAVPLGFGEEVRLDVRAAGIAAAHAIRCDPRCLRRLILPWLVLRAAVGPRVADPIRALVRRARAGPDRAGAVP